MNKIELTVKERLILPNIFPQASSRIEMVCIKGILESVSFSLEEITLFKLKDEENGAISGDIKSFKNKEIELSPEQIIVLRKYLKKLDNEGKVDFQLLPLFDKVDLLA